jgi:hypothetical protein
VVHVAIVIAIIPVVLCVPLAVMFIPPAMTSAPAPFPRLMQFVPRPFRLPALWPMMLDRFMQPVIRLGNAPLAIVVLENSQEIKPCRIRP